MLVRIIHKDGLELFTAEAFWYRSGILNTCTENKWQTHVIQGEPMLSFSSGKLEQVTVTAEEGATEK